MDRCDMPEPVALRRENGPDRPGDRIPARPDEAPRSGDATDGGRRELVCRACRTPVTRRDLAMTVDGAHRHVFFNPQGVVFEIGCFATARNVSPFGPRTGAFTWFPGYEWRAVACAGCAAQLGWRYASSRRGFFGLILDALVEEERP